MPQATDWYLLWYTDASCLVSQLTDVKEIESKLRRPSFCDWVLDNEQSIHFGGDNTERIVFARKH